MSNTLKSRSLEECVNRKIPLYVKLTYTAFMAVLLPVYWSYYGPANFLWISDVTLILAFIAVLFENKLLASMAAVGGLALELFWAICFSLALLFNVHFTDLADYMFDTSLPLWLRMLSLFHLALPPLLIWLVVRLGYLKKALIIQVLLTWLVIGASWLFTKPSENINWVLSYRYLSLDPLLYLILECLGIALILLMTHIVFVKISRK